MHRKLIALAAALLLTACSSDAATIPSAAPATTTPPLDPATTRPRPTTPTTTSPPPTTTTAPPTTSPPATAAPGTATLSPGGPWRLVDSAPGITSPGLVYELMPRLWVFLPVEIDPMNGVTWALTEENRPIIEAYLQARIVFFRATEQRPIDLDDPGWDEWYVDGGAGFAKVLAPRSAQGQIFDRTDGDVLRPVILPDDRGDGSFIVFDCMLDGGVWRFPDGSISADSVNGVIENGVSTIVRFDGDSWRIDTLHGQPNACA